jgi:hypothetical protein
MPVRLLYLLAVLAMPSWASYNGYNYRRSLTVDHTQVPNTDQTNFPVWVHISDTTLKTVANAGHVNNASGYDIVFASDATNSTPLIWDMDYYDGTNGVVDAWVKVPTLSHSSDYVFYVFYGNASISTYQSTATSAWNSNFKGVWHLPNGTTLTALDSTTSGNNGTKGSETATTIRIAGGADTSANDLTLPETTNSVWSFGDVSFSGWFKTTADSKKVFWNQNGTPLLAVVVGDPAGQGATAHKFNVYERIAGSVIVHNGTVTVDDGVAHHFYFTWASAGGTNCKTYVDGVAEISNICEPGTINTSSGGTHFFGTMTGGGIDEMRLESVVQTADWVSATYNNQKASSTFLTVGSESASLAAGRRADLSITDMKPLILLLFASAARSHVIAT